MVLYSVSVNIKKDIEQDWLDWMSNHHIAEVMRTGYFNNCKVYRTRLPAPEKDEAGYTIIYECESFDNYLAYSENEVSRLQKEHSDKFPGQFSASRMVLEEMTGQTVR